MRAIAVPEGLADFPAAHRPEAPYSPARVCISQESLVAVIDPSARYDLALIAWPFLRSMASAHEIIHYVGEIFTYENKSIPDLADPAPGEERGEKAEPGDGGHEKECEEHQLPHEIRRHGARRLSEDPDGQPTERTGDEHDHPEDPSGEKRALHPPTG